MLTDFFFITSYLIQVYFLSQDILKQVKVKNLDTGEEMDLIAAEEQLPQSLNPLSLHIMRLTSEYSCGGDNGFDFSDNESMISSVSSYDIGGKKKKRYVILIISVDFILITNIFGFDNSSMKKFLDSAVKKTTTAANYLAEEAKKAAKSKNEASKQGLVPSVMEVNDLPTGGGGLKRIMGHKSGPFDFEKIQLAQEIMAQHIGPIWCMRFSHCGQLMATAGQDKELKIWVLKSSYGYFSDMRTKYNAQKTSPTNSYDDVISDENAIKNPSGEVGGGGGGAAGGGSESKSEVKDEPENRTPIFHERPFCTYQGHTSDLLDVSWSKVFFIIQIYSVARHFPN